MVLVMKVVFFKATFFSIFEFLNTQLLTLAIAILNYNGRTWLEKFLPKVFQYSQEFPIYIIDNSSTDDSIEWIKSQNLEISIIQNQENYGFAEGYNQGLKKIKAEVYCLLNSDVEVTENWIFPVLQVFQKYENIAAVQPKILDYNRRNYFEYAGAAGGFIDNLGYPYCRGRLFFDIEEDQGQYDDISEIFWATGACLFVKSKCFWKVGGFDATYFAHMEEIDLCWRLKNEGFQIYYTGFSAVYHVGGGTLDASSPKKTFLNIRNSLFNLVKNLPKNHVFIVILQRLILDGLAAFYFLFSSGFSHFFAVVRAHFSFYWHLPEMLKKRKAGIKNYYATKYIVIEYFFKRRKTKKDSL